MKLVKNDLYLLLIDEEAEIKVNDLCLIDHNVGISTGYEILVCEEVEKDGWYHFTDFKTGRCSKIIAYYPLNSEAKELDLPLLPNLFEEVNVEKLAEEVIRKEGSIYKDAVIGKQKWIEGYKAAQQSNKQFSLEDMETLMEEVLNWWGGGRDKDIRDSKEFFEKYIQSLSTQQLPKEFIPEYEFGGVKSGYTIYHKIGENNILKTITNSEGKKEIQGSYKY